MSRLLDQMVSDFAREQMEAGRRQAELEEAAVAQYRARPAVQRIARVGQPKQQQLAR